MNNCDNCGKIHRPGSADARDCADAAFEDLLKDHNKWHFIIKDNQRDAVDRAYQRAKTEFNQLVPDVAIIRKIISTDFYIHDQSMVQMDTQKLVNFWEEFSDDRPPLLKVKDALKEIQMVWSEKKIEAILKLLKYSFTQWDTNELTIDIRSTDHLRRAADTLDRLEKDDWDLYHFEVSNSRVSWLHRKQKICNPV